MITALVLKIVLFAVALVVVVILVRRLFGGPTRAKARERIRPPRASTIAVAALLLLGLLAGMLGFGSGDMRDPVPFRIASVVLVVAGLTMMAVLAYRRRRRS